MVGPHGSDATVLDALSTTCMVCRPGGGKRAAGGQKPCKPTREVLR